MAISGSFYGTTANARIKPKLSWSAVQSVAGNYSDITAVLTYSRTNAGYTTAGAWEGSITLGNQTVTGQKRISITYQSNTEALTATFRVYHDTYGALRITLSATGAIDDSTLESTTISQEIQLDTIARPSAVSAASAAIGSRATVVVSRKSTAFSHSISYQFGQLTGWITADGQATATEKKFTAETVNFLLPDSFYAQIPNSKTGVCTLTCKTYQASTVIGQQTTTFVVNTDPNVCAPQISVTAVDIAPVSLSLTGQETKFVRYLSTAQCTISKNARGGAQLVSVSAEGKKVNGDTYTIAKTEKETVRFVVTDSRGYTGSYTLRLDMIPYVALTSHATVQRTDPTSGEAVLSLQGNCWNGSFPLEENTLSATYCVGSLSGTVAVEIGQNHTYRLDIPLQGLDYRQSYTGTLSLSDGAVTVRQNLTVHKGVPVFDWGEEDFRFNVPVELPSLTVNGIPLETYIRNIINS